MALPLVPHSNEYVFGRGKIYIDIFDDDGNRTGERFLGNCPGFTVNVESEKFEHFKSTTGIKTKDLSVTMSVTLNAQITCDDVSNENLALFLAGSTSTVAQSATPITNEAITVLQGREYQLGMTVSNPVGVKNVGSVSVTNVAGSTTYVLTDDYTVDADSGRIYIVEGGDIADDQVIHVDYTPVAGSYTRVASGAEGSLTGAVRFIADNAAGSNRDLYIASAELSPEGELPFITEDSLASFTFNVGVNERDSQTAQIYIDGRLVAS